jgi:hypothetical protein
MVQRVLSGNAERLLRELCNTRTKKNPAQLLGEMGPRGEHPGSKRKCYQASLATALSVSVRTIRNLEYDLISKGIIAVLADVRGHARWYRVFPFRETLAVWRLDTTLGHLANGDVCVRARRLMTVEEFGPDPGWNINPALAPDRYDAVVVSPSGRRSAPPVEESEEEPPAPVRTAPKLGMDDPHIAALVRVLAHPDTQITGAGVDAAYFILAKVRDKAPEIPAELLAGTARTIILEWRKAKRHDPLNSGLLATMLADEAGKWSIPVRDCCYCGAPLRRDEGAHVNGDAWRCSDQEACGEREERTRERRGEGSG